MARKPKAKIPKSKAKRKSKPAAAEQVSLCPKAHLLKLVQRCDRFDEANAADRGELANEIKAHVARHNLHPWAFRISRRLRKMGDLRRAEALYQLDYYRKALNLDQADLLPDRAPIAETAEQELIPTSGPGAPSDPVALQNLGRGNGQPAAA